MHEDDREFRESMAVASDRAADELRGTFVTRDVHVDRDAVLRASAWFPAPAAARWSASVEQILDEPARTMRALAVKGAVEVSVSGEMTISEFVAFGNLLGSPQPETAPSVQPFVEAAVVLNLVMQQPASGDVDMQPFAENPITLHTESSARAAADQPVYLAFLCREAPASGFGGQTLVVPMDDVHDRLSAGDRALLGQLRYADRPSPPILRTEDERAVFAFRDFDQEPLDWTYRDSPEPETTVEACNDALAALLSAMYEPSYTYGVHWRRGLLVVLDNRRFFHGRLFGTAGAGGKRRHLLRLRIRARGSLSNS